MKKIVEVTSFDDVLFRMHDCHDRPKDITADALAIILCPYLNAVRKSHGGPPRGAVKISYILGRMRAQKLVTGQSPSVGGLTVWRPTKKGTERYKQELRR